MKELRRDLGASAPAAGSIGASDRPRTGFVILSSDEASLLDTALTFADAQGFDTGLVIDNASSDRTAAIAAALHNETPIIDTSQSWDAVVDRMLTPADYPDTRL